ncbi:MAG TPA: guanylate kinase [Thermoanaerobaculia bacterium]|nr:guanylate kinase [Thermoanaerobaculia bacterium]
MSSETPVRGSLFLISAPSGAGKTTLIRRMTSLVEGSGELVFSVSHTTRRPRAGEVDGREYHFVERAEFERLAAAGEMLEWAEVHGRLYGTSKGAVLPHLEAGRDVIVDVDVQGAAQLIERFPEAQSVFVVPPSYEKLAQRLRGRGLDDEEEIARRLSVSLREILCYEQYQYVIVNDDLERAGRALAAIVLEKRLRRARQEPRIREVLADFGRARDADRDG